MPIADSAKNAPLAITQITRLCIFPVSWQPHLPCNAPQIIVIAIVFLIVVIGSLLDGHTFKLLSGPSQSFIAMFMFSFPIALVMLMPIQLVLLSNCYCCFWHIITIVFFSLFFFLRLLFVFVVTLLLLLLLLLLSKWTLLFISVCWFCYCFLSSFRSILAGGLDHKHCSCLIMLLYNLLLISSRISPRNCVVVFVVLFSRPLTPHHSPV